MNKLLCLALLLCLNSALAASPVKTLTKATPTPAVTNAGAGLEKTDQVDSLAVEALEKGFFYPTHHHRPRPQRRQQGGIVNQNRNYNSNSDFLSQYSSLYGQLYGNQQQSQRPYRPFYGKTAEEAEQDEVDFDETEPAAADLETVEIVQEKDGATEKGWYFPKPRPRPSSPSITNTNTNINTNSITDYSSLFSSLFGQLSSSQVQRPSRPGRPHPYHPYYPNFYGKSEEVAPEEDQAVEES